MRRYGFRVRERNVLGENATGLALEEKGFAIHQLQGGSEGQEERRRLGVEEESKGREKEMTRSTEGREALSRIEVSQLELSGKGTESMLTFGLVGIEEVVGGWGEEGAVESYSLRVTFFEMIMRPPSVSHSLYELLRDEYPITRAGLERGSRFLTSYLGGIYQQRALSTRR